MASNAVLQGAEKQTSASETLRRLKVMLLWPEMRMFWVIIPDLAVIFALAAYFISGIAVLIIGGLLFVIAVTLFVGIYSAANIERETRTERNEFRSMVAGLADALVVYDAEFRVLYWNGAAEKLFKLDAASVVGHVFTPQDVENPMWRTIAQVIFPALAPTMVSRSTAGEFPQIVDISFADPLLELRVMTSSIDDGEGNQLGFMKIIRDRTREITLIRSKNEFITVASHQLRTPVTEIRWAFETLVGDKTIVDQNRMIVEHGVTASHELLKIIDDLLNIAKIEEGHFGYVFQPMDIAEFLNGMLVEVLPIAKRAGLSLYFDRPQEELPKVMIDPQKLSLAVNNLIDNAIRYNTENGEITIKVAKVPNEPFVELSVKDTGIGMSADDLEKIFTKFFRAGAAMKYQTEGSGLGLYIAKNIVTAHGGKIWAESELNRGTTFYLTLPTDPRLVPQREMAME